MVTNEKERMSASDEVKSSCQNQRPRKSSSIRGPEGTWLTGYRDTKGVELLILLKRCLIINKEI